MASIKKRGDGYTVRWRDPDRRDRRKQTTTRTAAEQLVREIGYAHSLGKRWEPEGSRVVPSVDEAVTAFLSSMRRAWKANSLRTAAMELAVFVEWVGPSTPVGLAFTKRKLGEFWDHLVDARKCKPSTANDRVRSLERLWRWLCNDDDICEFVGRPKTIEKPTVTPSRVVVPTWAQVDALIEIARESARARLPWYRLLVVMRYTGLREGQAARLEWSDLDLTALTLTVRPVLGKSAAERRGRTIPIPEPFAAEVAGWGRREGALVGWPGVDTRSDVAPYLDTKGVRLWWRTTDADPDAYRGHPLHCIRKAYRTWLRAAGADAEAVEHLIGHSLGLAGIYSDESQLPLRATVDLVPAVGASVRGVSSMDAARATTPRGST